MVVDRKYSENNHDTLSHRRRQCWLIFTPLMWIFTEPLITTQAAVK